MQEDLHIIHYCLFVGFVNQVGLKIIQYFDKNVLPKLPMLLVPSDCTGICFHSPQLISFLRFLQIHCVCFGSDVAVLLPCVEFSLHGCCRCIPQRVRRKQSRRALLFLCCYLVFTQTNWYTVILQLVRSDSVLHQACSQHYHYFFNQHKLLPR